MSTTKYAVNLLYSVDRESCDKSYDKQFRCEDEEDPPNVHESFTLIVINSRNTNLAKDNSSVGDRSAAYKDKILL